MIKRILIALGGTPYSEVAVRRGIELASAHGATVVGVTILNDDHWSAGSHSMMSGSEVARVAEAQPWRRFERRLAEVIDEFRRSCADASVPCEVV